MYKSFFFWFFLSLFFICSLFLGVKEAWKNTCQNFFLSQTVSQVPYPAIPAATALTVSPPLIQHSSRWLGERGELKVRLTVEQPVIQWWQFGAYRDPTAAHPLVVQPGGQAYRWKPVRPLLRQSQRWNEACSNNPATPPSSHR
jgi:hypothetical protein